jgi:hypothetical protein
MIDFIQEKNTKAKTRMADLTQENKCGLFLYSLVVFLFGSV